MSTTEGGFGDGLKNPATRKLIEQILFTRRFVPTYLAVLGVLVLLFSAAHWWTKLIRSRTRRERSKEHVAGEDDSPTSSSSSSTLQGTLSPSDRSKTSPRIEAIETTRLLSGPEPVAPQLWSSIIHRVRCRFASMLSYQPSPIRALTSPTNTLPENGMTLLILTFLALNIFYLFYHTPISIPMLFVFADRAGLLFVVNLPVLYILAAKTNQPLKFLTGSSYEGLNIFHRRLGEMMIVLAVLHSVGMFGVWYTLLRPLHFTLLRFLSTKLVILGIAALTSYLAIWVTSIGFVRKLWYETFLGTHVFLQVAAMVLLYFHHPGATVYVLMSIGIWALDRIVARLAISTTKFVATLQIADDRETVLLFCEINVQKAMGGARLNISHGWEAGQHTFVTVPRIGWKHRLQAHPFTIASPAPPYGYQGSWPLQLTIRVQDGFSRELLEYAKLHQHTEIILDGPYGSLDALEALRTAERRCLIAGGSGIAVTYPLAWSLLVRNEADALMSSRVIYRNGLKHAACVQPLDHLLSSDRLAHFWIRQFDKHCRWITMFPQIEAMKDKLSPVMAAMNDASEDKTAVSSLISRAFSTQEDASNDRPDVALELRQWVENVHEELKHCRICVLVSGPDGLVRDSRNAAARLTLEGWDIEVFVEKFGW